METALWTCVAGAPSSKRPQALKRGHSPASIVCRANLTYSASVELNVDGTVDMRSGGSVLEVPQAPMRGHSPASIVREPSQQTAYKHRKGSPYTGEPFLYVQLALTA